MPQEYTTLYRAFRPDRFSAVIGQQPIVQTLKNQIKSGRIAHAYLFNGTRGTGKTTTARILARAINCENPQDGEPCGQCPTCKTLAGENNLDILEIDAASNGSVDQVRDLCQKVAYPPQSCRYKVIIIDEVHSLSTSAASFNALLKTLEEPPEHAVFILATTDPQKLPPTILSRCQRFDFKRIGTKDIADHLNLSRSRFCHLFKDFTGTSPWNYIIARRIQHACTLLQKGMSITDVCFECGFNDYAHFVKSFTKLVGISPGKYSKTLPGNTDTSESSHAYF